MKKGSAGMLRIIFRIKDECFCYKMILNGRWLDNKYDEERKKSTIG